jgi:4-amino-4-deoxy-L-arabinose transferase-like glycosyltransferase
MRHESPEDLTRTRVLMMLAAFGLSLGLSWALLRHWRRRRIDPSGMAQGVTVFGQYSPVLTWIQKVWQHRGNRIAPVPQPESKAPLPAEGQSATIAPSAIVSAALETIGAPASPPPPATTEVIVNPPASSERSDDRAAQVNVSMRVPPGTRVRVTVEALADGSISVAEQTIESRAAEVERAPRRAAIPDAQWRRLRLPAWARSARLELVLAGAALLVYAVTRFVGLDQYPIYFFSDEAVQTVRAAQLVNGAGRYGDEFLPTYFDNGPFWNLSVSVYAQVVPYLIFGASVVVTRAVSASLSLLAAIAVALTLRDVWRVRYWWAATLLLGLMPVWFLHSRTAFESVEMASFFAVFLYAYLRYRAGAVRWLYGAAVFGALAFYTYSPGQIVMAVTGFLLLIADARYHWQQRATVLRVALVLIVMALPYVRFQFDHRDAAYLQLRERGSYLLEPNVPAWDKITRTVAEYLYGLSPMYWYSPNNSRDLARHLMPGHGNLPWWTLPFGLIGFGLALWRALGRERDPAYRALLLALLAVPTGGALAEAGNLRVLSFVIPATVFTALGLAQVLQWLERRVARWQLALAAFVILSGINGWMLRDALVNGPTWNTDYGLYGMQYGARQVFGELIPRLLRENPTARVIVSPSWANGAHLFQEFFVPEAQWQRLEFQGMDHFRTGLRELDNTLLIWPAEEYYNARDEPKFGELAVQEILPYPTGSPGFYVLRLSYAEDAREVFAAEAAALRQPVTETVTLAGQTVAITHSQLESGRLADVFDGDAFTVVRGAVDNPLFFDLRFATPRPITRLALTTGTMPQFTVRVRAYPPSGPVWTTQQAYGNLDPDPTVTLVLDGAPARITRLLIEILDEQPGDPPHIHVREIVLNP